MSNIFIHGLWQKSDSWQETIDRIDDDFPALCPDLLALLDGARPIYSNLYQAFCAYCDNQEGPFVLCGLSLGGILALHYTLDHPDKVEKLIIIGAQYKMPRLLLELQNFFFRFMPAPSFEKLGMSKSDMMRLTKSMASLNFSGRLAEITCPTLVACGERDKANQKAAKQLARRIPGAELQVIENAGHEVNKDTPKKLAGVLYRFLGA